MGTPGHNRRFRGGMRRKAEAAARFAKRMPMEHAAAREEAALRRDPDARDALGLLPAGRLDWIKP